MTFPGDAITQYQQITHSTETNFYQVLCDALDETQNTIDTHQTQKHKG